MQPLSLKCPQVRSAALAAGAATAVALELGAAIGFDAVVVGGREAFAMVEQHAALWIALMRRGWGRDFGFAVIGSPRRGEP